MPSSSYTISNELLSEVSNQVKEVLVDYMAGEGLINHDQAREVKRNWAVIIKEKNIFGKLWDKWRGIEEKGQRICILRACNAGNVSLDDPIEEEEIKVEETKEKTEGDNPTAQRFNLDTAQRFNLELP